MSLNLDAAGWLAVLEKQLDAQTLVVEKHSGYYDGNHPLQFATQKFREAFSRYFPPMANNWCQLVVDAATERLEVQGFRFGTPEAGKPDWNSQADTAAWELWQANNLDGASTQAHNVAVKCGTAYAMVEPADPYPLITIEHPSQVVVATVPGRRRLRRAALKRWIDEDEHVYATLYLPNQILKFRSKAKANSETKTDWQLREDDPGGVNPLGVVPIIPIENNPDLLGGGRSDLEVAEPIQDAVNKLCLDMLVTSDFHAFPMKWATGWEVPRDENGDVAPYVELLISQSKAWISESPDTKFGQIDPSDLKAYIEPIDMYIDHLAAITRTPAYYLKGKMANLSADALRAAETGLVYRVKRKTVDFGDAWEDVMRLAFLASGDTAKAGELSAETLWADPEAKSLGQLVDAAVKLRQSLSAPLEMCWQMIGWTPQQIQQALSTMKLPQGGPGSTETQPVLPAA